MAESAILERNRAIGVINHPSSATDSTFWSTFHVEFDEFDDAIYRGGFHEGAPGGETNSGPCPGRSSSRNPRHLLSRRKSPSSALLRASGSSSGSGSPP